jgi:hypothetical protein
MTDGVRREWLAFLTAAIYAIRVLAATGKLVRAAT